MGRKKGGPSRMDMRRANDAAEARERDEDVVTEEVETEEEVEEVEVDEEGDDDEGGSSKKKKPAKKAAKKPAVKRTRTAKEVRLRAVWVVFDNASKRVETFPFSQKKEAEELLAKKIEEKKTTFYLNLVKDPYE